MKTVTNDTTDPPIRGQLPAEWTTPRLLVRDGAAEEAPALADLFNACAYVGAWDPTFYHVETPEIGKLLKRSASAEEHASFRLQTLRRRDDGRLAGYFHLFHSAPQPEVCWVSMFVIHPEHQRLHLAQEAVNSLAYHLREAGYEAIWLEVFLRNWPALRFWTIMGFTTIIGYEGDREMGEGKQARLLLAREL